MSGAVISSAAVTHRSDSGAMPRLNAVGVSDLQAEEDVNCMGKFTASYLNVYIRFNSNISVGIVIWVGLLKLDCMPVAPVIRSSLLGVELGLGYS